MRLFRYTHNKKQELPQIVSMLYNIACLLYTGHIAIMVTKSQDPGQSLGFLVHEIARLLRKDFDQRAKDLGLTQVQWRAMVYLSRNEGLKQVELAEILEIQPISLARLVDRLAASGWVERRADPDDRRAQRLFLTPEAKPLLEQINKIATQTRANALQGLSNHDHENLIATLAVIKGNLSNTAQPAIEVANKGLAQRERRTAK